MNSIVQNITGGTQLDVAFNFFGSVNGPDSLPVIFALSYRTAQDSPHIFYARYVPAEGLAENFAIDAFGTLPTTSLYSFAFVCREGKPVPRLSDGSPFLLRITSDGKTANGTLYMTWAWRRIS